MPDCIGDVKALKNSFEKNRDTVAMAIEKIRTAADLYKTGKPTRDGLNFFYHMAGLFGQRLYFYGKTANYTSSMKINTSVCTDCGKCEKLCPMKNVHIKNGKAVSSDRCTMCYRCFVNCPKQAITIIGSRVFEQHKIERYI